MSPVDPSTIGLYSEGVRLLDDRPCLRCGYNLRGLMDTGMCPECGSPVRDSLRGNLLRYASPEYVALLERGARCVWWSIAIVLIAIVLMVLERVFMAMGGGPVPPMAGGGVLAGLLGLVMLVPALLSLLGWWMLAAPDPADARGGSGAARRVLRVCLIVSAVCFVVSFTLGAITGGPGFVPPSGVGPGGPTPLSGAAMLAGAANLVSTLAWLVQFYASMLYVRTLAFRFPDERIAKRAKALMWAVPISAGAAVVTFLVALTLARPPGGGGGGGMAIGLVVMIPCCGIIVGGLVLFVMYVSLVDRLHRLLKAVRAEVESLAAS
ncbi:MAG: hypothetical protein ACKVU4_12265 [Phycisphaerales bacterium]